MFTISESRLDSFVTDLELEVPNYDLYRIDRQNKKGGGVCVYESLNYNIFFRIPSTLVKNQSSKFEINRCLYDLQTSQYPSVVFGLPIIPQGTIKSHFVSSTPSVNPSYNHLLRKHQLGLALFLQSGKIDQFICTCKILF